MLVGWAMLSDTVRKYRRGLRYIRLFSNVRSTPSYSWSRIGRCAAWSPFPDNCWVGVTATDTNKAISACYELQDIEASVKYLSLEPLLGWILSPEWAEHPTLSQEIKDAGINWLIVGAQSKPYKAPDLAWVEEIAKAATQARIPLFVKDNLEKACLEVTKKELGQFSFWEKVSHSSGELVGVQLKQEIPE